MWIDYSTIATMPLRLLDRDFVTFGNAHSKLEAPYNTKQTIILLYEFAALFWINLTVISQALD